MAAIVGVRNFGLKVQLTCSQSAKFLPVIQQRLMSNGKSGSKKTDSGQTSKQMKDKPEQYNVPEYYSHNKDTFADYEIEMAGYRQSQPDPRVPYFHHYPWDKK